MQQEKIAAVVVLLGSIGAWLHAGQYSAESAIFPRIVIGAMGLLSGAMLLRTGVRPSADQDGRTFLIHPRRFSLALALTGGYVAGIYVVGYYASSAVFIPAFAWSLGHRRPLATLGTTVVFLALMFVMFELVFGRPLPVGTLLSRFD